MNHLRTAGPALALALLFAFAPRAGADDTSATVAPTPAAAPAPAQAPAPAPAGKTVPAKADEGPTTYGPIPVATPAATTASQQSPADDFGTGGSEEPDSLFGTLLKTMLMLGIIIGLIYLTLNYGLRRLMGVKGMPGRSGLVQVVERIPLDPKRTLFVLHAGGEYLLVGGADQNLQLISKLDPETVQATLAQNKLRAAQPSPFLEKLLQKKPKPPAENEKV